MTCLLVNLILSSALAGLVWTVQLVHYPLMESVGARRFAAYHEGHVTRMTRVVAPLMLGEIAAAAWLAATWPPQLPAWVAWVVNGAVLICWVSTAVLQVPLHRRLERGLDVATVRKLTATNWVRTAAWTGRTAMLAWWVLPTTP